MTTLIQKVTTSQSVWAKQPQFNWMIAPTAPFEPFKLIGLTISRANPTQMSFHFSEGETQTLSQIATEREMNKLLRYFSACLAIPDTNLWVNLSPYEPHRIMSDALAMTDYGTDMLEQDIVLKRLAASLLHPEGSVGLRFWTKLEAQMGINGLQTPIILCQKVWICPDEVSIQELNEDDDGIPSDSSDANPGDKLSVYLTKVQLKVNVNIDNLALRKQLTSGDDRLFYQEINETGVELFREIILPEIQRELDHGRLFGPFRQQYAAWVLAKWIKQQPFIKQHPALRDYIDKNKPNQLMFTIRRSRQLRDSIKTPPEQCLRQDLEQIQRVFGYAYASPISLKMTCKLIQRLLDQEDYDCARFLQEEVLKTQKKVLGPQHQVTYKSKQILDQIMEKYSEVSPSDHPSTSAPISTLVAEAEEEKAQVNKDKDPNQSVYDYYLMMSKKGIFTSYTHPSQNQYKQYFSGGMSLTHDGFQITSTTPKQ